MAREPRLILGGRVGDRLNVRSYLARSHYDERDPAKLSWLETTRLQFKDFHGDWGVWLVHKHPKVVLNPLSWVAQLGPGLDLPQFLYDSSAPWSGDWYLNAVEAAPFGQDVTNGTRSGGATNPYIGTAFANSADPLY